MESRTILIVSFAIFVALLILSIFVSANFALSTNILLVAIIVLILPYYIHRFLEFKKIKSYEKHFPAFLRDLAEAQRAGLTIVQAIRASSKSDYGLLSIEIKKINNQLSWNVTLEKVLDNFSKRMKTSRIITRSILVIDQANKSGGNIEDTMDSLANNIELLRDVQEEKSTLLNQQVVLMYAIFFIFLGISITLIRFLVPLLQSQSASQGSLFGLGTFQGNPCIACIDSSSIGCAGCTTFFTVSSTFNFGEKEDPAAYYRSLFFTMVIVQGFFTGLIAGQIGSDSVTAGIKHSLIMLFSGFFVFIFCVQFGII